MEQLFAAKVPCFKHRSSPVHPAKPELQAVVSNLGTFGSTGLQLEMVSKGFVYQANEKTAYSTRLTPATGLFTPSAASLSQGLGAAQVSAGRMQAMTIAIFACIVND